MKDNDNMNTVKIKPHISIIRYLFALQTLLMMCVVALMTASFPAHATLETLLDGTEFNSTSAFLNKWNYNYPWGQTHNGSAKMWSSNETVSAGVLTMPSYPFVDGTYNYSSGTVYSKWQVLVNSTYPTYTVSGDFQCESQRGTWPAFWLTGANSWPPESDIMEYKGSTTCWLNTYDGLWESLGVVVASPGSWHTYKAVLTQLNTTDVTIQYYIDGVLKSTQTGSGFVGQPMWLIIDYQMEGSSGTPGPATTTYMRGKNVQVSRDNLVTTLPAVPGSVTTAAVNGTARVLWSTASGASSYNVKRATASGGPYTTIENVPSTTQYLDTGLVNGTTYYYVVSAVNPIGESANSVQASATPAIPLDMSKPVTASSVQSGNDSFNGNDGDLTTRWTAVDATYPQWWRVDLGSVQSINKAVINWYSPLSRSYKYQIEISNDDSTYTLLVDKSANSVNGDTTDIFSASARYVRVTVTGVTPAGGYAAFYECQIFGSAPPPPPAPPTGFTATTVSSSQINLNWTASSGATSYNVKRATVSGGPYTTIATGVTSTGYSDTGLSASTTYYYVVSAVNAGGQSANSAQASATTLSGGSVPAAPMGLAATAGNAQVALSWTASSGATSYRIKRATVSGGPYMTIATNTTTSFTNTSLVNGTTYYYVVSAVNAIGEGANSAQVSATPSAGSLPPAPTGLTVTLTGNNTDVRLNWTAVSGANSYKVKRATVNGGPYTLIASPSTNTYTDTGSKTQGTTYYYVVSTVNVTGEGPNSSQVSIVP